MHEEKLMQLNIFFKEIKEKNNEIDFKFNDIQTKLNKLKDTFRDFSVGEQQKLLIYCLDTLGFNNKIFYHDLNKVKELYDLLINRIYGDLYKFYNLLIDYVNKSIDDKIVDSKIKNNNNFPKYNNIDLTIKYEFNNITKLYQIIIELLEAINEHIKSKKKNNNNNKDIYKEFNDYMNIYNEHVNIKINKINMFFDYIIYISTLHVKYMNNTIQRINTITDDIDFEINNDLDENGDGIFDMKDLEIKQKKYNEMKENKKQNKKNKQKENKNIPLNKNNDIEEYIEKED